MAEKQTRKSSSKCCADNVCELYCFNLKQVKALQAGLPDDDILTRAEQIFSALGNRTRLMILHCLARAEELCVCDIANALEMNLSTISHQLRHLRGLSVVAFRSEGKMAFYRLADSRVADMVRAELGRTTVQT